MFSEDIYIDGLTSDSKYVFQYCKNVELHNAKIVTKDSFWECENITIYDSELDGEYLAWHSKNVRLVNCHLAGEQLLCYADNLILENCTFDKACDRIFEYSIVNANISGKITNIKNYVDQNSLIPKTFNFNFHPIIWKSLLEYNIMSIMILL